MNPRSSKYTGEGSGRKRNEIYRYFADDSARTKQKIDFIEDQEWEDMLGKRRDFDAIIGSGLTSVLEDVAVPIELFDPAAAQAVITVSDV